MDVLVDKILDAESLITLYESTKNKLLCMHIIKNVTKDFTFFTNISIRFTA